MRLSPGLGFGLGSMLRAVVVPRAVPTRLARAAFPGMHWLLRLRLWLTGRSDYTTRDRIFVVQAPLGLFAQLAISGLLIWVLFAALFWSLTASVFTAPTVSRALELSGSSMLKLGLMLPRGFRASWRRSPLLSTARSGVVIAWRGAAAVVGLRRDGDLPQLRRGEPRRGAFLQRLRFGPGRVPGRP